MSTSPLGCWRIAGLSLMRGKVPKSGPKGVRGPGIYRVQVVQGPSFTGSKFYRVHVLQGARAAAVDGNAGAAEVGGGGGEQERSHPAQLVRVSVAAQRDRGLGLGPGRRRVAGCLVQLQTARRCEPARQDGVDPDSSRPE